MPEARPTSPGPYSNSGDFRRAFSEEIDSLYVLSLLLAAEPEKAEQCFVSGLEDSVNGKTVFKECAHSWARRAIIERCASHQAEANGGNCPFELRQRQNDAGGAGRDRRGASTRAVRSLCLRQVGSGRLFR
jgi:hypothetical protein